MYAPSPLHRSPVAPLIFVALLLTLTVGCQDAAAPEGASPDPPKVLEFPSGAEASNQDGGEVGVVTMCEMTRFGDSMLLVKVSDYSTDDAACEERPYRLKHGDLSAQLVAHIAGDEQTSPLQVVDHGPTMEFGRLVQRDDYIILNVQEVDGVLFAARNTLVAADGQFETKPTSADHIFDLPTDFDEFIRSAQDHWTNFESLCDGQRNPEGDLSSYERYFGEKECTQDLPGQEANAGEASDTNDDHL